MSGKLPRFTVKPRRGAGQRVPVSETRAFHVERAINSDSRFHVEPAGSLERLLPLNVSVLQCRPGRRAIATNRQCCRSA